MSSSVVCVVRLIVARHRLGQRDDPLDLLGRGVFRGQRGGAHLDRSAHVPHFGHADLRGGDGMLERFGEHAAVERADLGAAAVGDVDLLQRGERAERLAHHRAADAQLLGEIGFAGQRVADAQLLGADMVLDRVDRGADQGLARKRREVGHAATPLDLSSLGDWPKRRPKARLKLALFE